MFKKMISFVAVVGLVLALAPAANAMVVAHWEFEPGSLLVDSVSGHTLIQGAGLVTSSGDVPTGGGSGSAYFDGSSALSVYLPLASYGSVPLRVSYAVKSATIAGPGIVAEHSADFNSSNGAWLVDVNEGGLAAGAASMNTSLGLNIDNYPVINDGSTWERIQVDYDPAATNAADVVRVTKNGVLVSTEAGSPWDAAATGSPWRNDILYVGARAGNAYFYGGLLDDLKIELPSFPVNVISEIDIVAGVVDPGPERTSNAIFPNAFDDDNVTFTWTTESGAQAAPQYTRLDFAGDDGYVLGRIRINDIAGNGAAGEMEKIIVRYTTDTDADLNARAYQNVSNLAVSNDFPGDAATLPNVNVFPATARIQHLDVAHDGYYSVTFDPVAGVTGIEFEWQTAWSENPGTDYHHWGVREIEAYEVIPEPSTFVLAALGLLGLGLYGWRRRRMSG